MTEWEALRQECLHCHACTLAETRTNVVFGVGREDAEIMSFWNRSRNGWKTA